jgi:hypothetical protein
VATDDRLARRVRELRYSVRYVVNAHPSVYMPLARRWHDDYENRFIEPDTELVIEGFGRSGSTFAVLAFEMAQERPVKTAHHTHASAQVVVAAERAIPTVVIIRRPRDAVLAHMVRRRISARPAVKSWIRYHERILPYADRLLVARLETVSTDLGSVIRAINDRFGTSFAIFDHTPEREASIFRSIEETNVRKYGQATDWVARPTGERLARKEARRTELEDPRLRSLFERAQALYDTLLAPSGGA